MCEACSRFSMAHKPVLTCLSGDGLSCNSVSVYVILHELVGRYAEYRLGAGPGGRKIEEGRGVGGDGLLYPSSLVSGWYQKAIHTLLWHYMCGLANDQAISNMSACM